MVQLNPVPVFGAKKKNTSTTEISVENFRQMQMVSALELQNCRVEIQIPMRILKCT